MQKEVMSLSDREILRKMEHSEEFREPQNGQNVWPYQYCPKFSIRSSGLNQMSACWFCRHADFRFEQTEPLKVGICCYPEIKNY